MGEGNVVPTVTYQSGASTSSEDTDLPPARPLATSVDSTEETSPATAALRAHQERNGTLAALEEDEDDAPPTPRFMQDEHTWRHWKWVPYPVRRFWIKTVRWTRGPPDARPFVIVPVLPAVQAAPQRALDELLDWLVQLPWPPRSSGDVGGSADKVRRRHGWRCALYAGWLGLWLLVFALVLRHGLATGELGEWGIPGDIGCGNTYWVAGNGCGLDGSDCRPFKGGGFAFRCPASCSRYQVLNPRAVGAEEVVYQTLVVGGGPASSVLHGPPTTPAGLTPFYRGDSFICSAAIHAGVISDAAGGCGVVRLVGTQTRFAAAHQHGIASVGFDSQFPLAFAFERDVTCPGGARDMRWTLLAVSVVFSTVLSLLVSDPAAFFFAIFTGLFWHVGLASDPRPHVDMSSLVSAIVGAFLPAALTAWVLFDRMGVRRTLHGLAAPMEKTMLWLGGCWVGALDNYTFDHIPIQRLTPHDLAQQPGARAALAVIVLVLVCVVASQVWVLRQEGRLRRFLLLYGLFGAGLLVCLALPGLSLRIHHYVLALLLLPGTAVQTRPALLYQGLLVGLFINGIARWGWDPVLQTAAALQEDAQLGSPLPEVMPPVIEMASTVAHALSAGINWRAAAASPAAAAVAAVAAANTSSILFAWRPPPGPRYGGISVLVNDVERYRGFYSDVDSDASGVSTDLLSFTWKRPAGTTEPTYFRFAFMEGSTSADYTRAGIWTADGAWVPMPPGPSRVRSRNVEGWR